MAKGSRKDRSLALPNFIGQWCKYRGMTPYALAKKTKMTPSNISQIISRKQGFSADSLKKMAEALNCSPAELLAYDPFSPEYQLHVAAAGLSKQELEQALRILKAIRSENAA